MSNTASAIELLSIGSRTTADHWGPSWLSLLSNGPSQVVAEPRVKAEQLAESGPPAGADETLVVGDEACQRCGSTEYIDTEIHDGRSTRRDCRACNRTQGFPRWCERPSSDAEAERVHGTRSKVTWVAQSP
jgi:hypothetical protein